jgi:hypothetical protein
MMTHRFLIALIASLALDASYAAVADAQQPAYNRGSTKVRSRLVNPFDVSSSGLSVDPFGVVRYQPRPRMAFAPASLTSTGTAAAAAALSPVAPIVATTTATATSASDDSLTTAARGTGGDALADSTPQAAGDVIGQGSMVRPPFRPPVRSPFRPPPRPPF